MLDQERTQFGVRRGKKREGANEPPHRLLMGAEGYEDHSNRPIISAFG
jgi:hypothetical protein